MTEKVSMKLKNWPSELDMGVSTICNSKCVFCTREKLIENPWKTIGFLSFSEAKAHIDYIYGFLFANENLDVGKDCIPVSFTDLGEVLLNPDYFKILDYARAVFTSKARLSLSTNCIALDEKMSESIINSPLDVVILSLANARRDVYKVAHGIDKFDDVISNIRNFLKLRGNRKPRATIHILDKGLSADDKIWFENAFNLAENDVLQYRPYSELNSEPAIHNYDVCPQPWHSLYIDIDGRMFACHMSAFNPVYNESHIGNIGDRYDDVTARIIDFRKRLLAGDFGNCVSCGFVTDRKECS